MTVGYIIHTREINLSHMLDVVGMNLKYMYFEFSEIFSVRMRLRTFSGKENVAVE